jgi:hypothetical protein
MEAQVLTPFDDLSLIEIANANVQCRANPTSHHDVGSLQNSARNVMTDFESDHPVVIAPDRTVQDARTLMESATVSMLIVASKSGAFRGLLRSNDVLGPGHVIAAELNGVTADEVLVRDVMRPKKMIHGLDIGELDKAKIGEVLATLKHLGEPDILVIDNSVTPSLICGVLSVSDISRELGIDFDISSRARTFADLQQVLNAG